MGRASLRSEDFPGGPPRRPRTAHRRRPRAGRFRHVSIGNPQCAIHVGDRGGAGGARPAGDRPARSKTTRGSPTARTCPGTPSSRRRAERGSTHPHPRADLRARRGGDAVLGHRRQRRRGRALLPRSQRRRGRRDRDARDGRCSTAASSRSRWGRICSVNLTGWARPVFAGQLSEDLEKELHETE